MCRQSNRARLQGAPLLMFNQHSSSHESRSISAPPRGCDSARYRVPPSTGTPAAEATQWLKGLILRQSPAAGGKCQPDRALLLLKDDFQPLPFAALRYSKNRCMTPAGFKPTQKRLDGELSP